MEGKKQPGSTCPPPPPSSLVTDLFGEKRTPSSSSSGLFNSVFPPASSVMGKDKSQPVIFGPSKKYEGPDGKPRGGASRGGSVLNNNKNAIYQNEKADPCLFGSSLYYGDRDVCNNTSSSPDTRYNYKKEGEDDSNNSNVALRGNWWQGMRETMSLIMCSMNSYYLTRPCLSRITLLLGSFKRPALQSDGRRCPGDSEVM